jgi:hypothetical protein
MPEVKSTLIRSKEEKEEEERRRKANLGELKLRLKEISYYLRRKRFDAEAKEDPILILQQLGVISLTGFHLGLAQGSWGSNGPDDKSEYKPPIIDFVDMGGKPHSYSDIKTWVNWQAIHPLLQMAHEQLQAKIERLQGKTSLHDEPSVLIGKEEREETEGEKFWRELNEALNKEKGRSRG